MNVRHLMWANLTTGLISVVWFVNSLSDPAYWDPVTFNDYLGSVLAEVFFLAAAYTLVVWWRVTPIRRGVQLLPITAVGFVMWSAGNVLEEIMGIGFGEWVYFGGAAAAMITIVLAGLATLTAPSRWRWTGLVLLAIFASFAFEELLDGIPISPVPWLAFAFVLSRGILDAPALNRSSNPA